MELGSEGGRFMSLKSKLSGTKEKDKEFQRIVKRVTPNKKIIKTVSGVKAFSDEYKMEVPNELNNTYQASVSGTAFDYLARFFIGQVVNKGRWNSFLKLNALKGLLNLRFHVNPLEYSKLEDRYISYLSNIMEFIYSDAAKVDGLVDKVSDEIEFKAYQNFLNKKVKSNYKYEFDTSYLVAYSVYFAKLEMIYRSKIIPEKINVLTNLDMEQYNDLSHMCDIFFKNFLDSGLITPKSDVVYNPTFGKVGHLVGGADADIYIDGVLYDFKSTKTNAYKWQDFAQIISYYLLNELTCQKDDDALLRKKKINSIALYKSRFGEIEYIDMTDISSVELNKVVENLKTYFSK